MYSALSLVHVWVCREPFHKQICNVVSKILYTPRSMDRKGDYSTKVCSFTLKLPLNGYFRPGWTNLVWNSGASLFNPGASTSFRSQPH